MANQPKVKPLCPPGQAPRFEDVIYGETILDNGEAYTLKMDIYQDPNQKTPGPCIIYYFGGGWMWGEYKQVTQKAVYCRDLVKLTEEGYTVVSPSYRLVTQSAFPACIHDCKGVVRFLKAHAQEFNIDPERIGVLGNSAGGHLAAMVAMSSGCKEMEGEVGGNLEFSSDVKAAAVFYAPTDLLAIMKQNNQKEQERNLEGTEIENVATSQNDPWIHIFGYPEPENMTGRLSRLMETEDREDPDWKYIELAKSCSPVTYASEDCPPMIIFHGGQDPVVPIEQSEVLYKALSAAGAKAMYLTNSEAGHGPSMGTELDQMAYQFLKNRL